MASLQIKNNDLVKLVYLPCGSPRAVGSGFQRQLGGLWGAGRVNKGIHGEGRRPKGTEWSSFCSTLSSQAKLTRHFYVDLEKKVLLLHIWMIFLKLAKKQS